MQALAGACYTSPEFFALERERILLPSWQLVCHIADLPAPGTAIRFDFLGRSALLLRGADGTVRGFSNVCRHRGSRLIDGDATTGLAFCVDGRVRCPSHGWEYDHAGALGHVHVGRAALQSATSERHLDSRLDVGGPAGANHRLCPA